MSAPTSSRYKDELVAATLCGSTASIYSLSNHIDMAEDYDINLCICLSPLINPAHIPSNLLYNTTTYAKDPDNMFQCVTVTSTIITLIQPCSLFRE
ncbi:hypothetical protein H1R20_g4504, partial [Candolleomyces eurysporus]